MKIYLKNGSFGSFLTLIMLLFSMPAFSADIQSITVYHESLISGTQVLLGQISTIEGSLDSIEKIENLVICAAPAPKKSRRISRPLIASRLRKAGILTNNIHFECPEEVLVKADYIEFSRETLEDMIVKHIMKNISWDKDLVKVKNVMCKPVILPKGRVSFSFNSDRKDTEYISSYYDEITFVVNNSFRKKLKVSARIVVVAPVAVSTRVIEKNSIIKLEDVKLIPRDITAFSNHILTDLSMIIGKKAKARINADAVIKDNLLGRAPVIKKGDAVTIFLENKTLKVTVPGKALERGAIGETIKVSNTSSDTALYAVVRSSKSVEVLF